MTQPKELTDLQRLVGNWKVNVVARMPDGGEQWGSGTIVAEPICSDYGVKTILRVDVEGIGPYEEHDLWGLDRDTGLLHLYSVTSSGAVHDHVGNMRDGRSIEFHWLGLHDGKDTVENLILEFASPKEIHIHETDTVDGKPGPVFDYYMKRA